MSESWDRDNLTLDKIIKLDKHTLISNVHQRTGVGGRPALIINHDKFIVQNLTQSVVQIPWGVEMVWALITPKNWQSDSKIQRIVLGAVYSKPYSKKKTITLDHISDVFNLMSIKYVKGLHFIISGDTNELKLDQILQLSPNMNQVVKDFTRLNPPRILDPIITTLSQYYQKPLVLPPLDPDPDKNRKPSDHKIVKMKPINTIENKPARTKRQVTLRPIPESGLQKMTQWANSQDWATVINATSAHEKENVLQDTLMKALNKYLPTKTVNFSSDDSPWVPPQIKSLFRRRQREYTKHRRSVKWYSLDKKVMQLVSKSKSKYYKNVVEDIKKLK